MQEMLKIAYSKEAMKIFGPIKGRESVLADETDFIDVASLIITDQEVKFFSFLKINALHLPVFLIMTDETKIDEEIICQAAGIIEQDPYQRSYYERKIENAASQYEKQVLPPFFKRLLNYVEEGNSEFSCPGHQGGNYFKNILQDVFSIIFTEKIPSGEIYAMRTWRWEIC